MARMLRALDCWLLVTIAALPATAASPERFDVVVYGGTAAGVVAAVQARRMGRTVVLLEPGRHLGGLTTGGLGHRHREQGGH